MNNELGYVRAVFNELRDLGQIDFENPLVGVKPLKLQERELSWLTSEQIAELLEAIRNGCENPHTELVTLLCLATGARWSEAEKLMPNRLQGNIVTFAGTKSGKVRSVPIPVDLADRIRKHWRTNGQFTSCITSFRRALERTTIQLPQGQASHALRHSFASHFIMNGGNILTLQKILGHSTLAMTMRYAHLSPDHLADAVRLGPLSDSSLVSTVFH
ncbi:Tyrosine recombinase XerC [compost metagenome]